MGIYRMTSDKLEEIPATSFANENIMERGDLQRLLRDQPDVLEDDLFILSEEFSRWQDSGRSIDLLGLDSTGRLTVIELKRTRTGDYAELQAIRYAAMVANLTFEQIVESHRDYLHKRSITQDAQDRICEHLGIEKPDDAEIYTERPRIVLVSEGFSNELTTSVLWLNDNYGLDIRCVRLQPYRHSNELLVETSQLIPLPEASDYQTQFRERENEVQRQRSSQGQYVRGGVAFKESIGRAPERFRNDLERLYDWAAGLELEGLARLSTWLGTTTTLPVNVPKDSALVSIYNQTDAARIYFQANVFRRIAPNSIPLMNELIGGDLQEIRSSTGRHLSQITQEILSALTEAYREANGLLTDD